MNVVLIRGASGSGKSTFAKKHYSDFVHLETDKFFMRNGEYKFDYTKIKQAHEWCKNLFKDCLESNRDVVVTNTFIKLWEIQPYLDMCSDKQITPLVIVMDNTFENIHNVSENIIKRQRTNIELLCQKPS